MGVETEKIAGMHRLKHAAGFVLWSAIGGGLGYVVVDEFIQLFAGMEARRLLVRFDMAYLFLPGALLCFGALCAISIAAFFGREQGNRFVFITRVMIAVSLFAAILGRFGGSFALSSYLAGFGYEYCPDRSKLGPRVRDEAWVLDPVVCEVDVIPEELTVDELDDFIKQISNE